MQAAEIVTRLRPGTSLDPYSGEPRPDWTTPDEMELRAAVADSGSSEPLEDGRAPLDTDFTLYIEGAPDVLAGDRIVVRGLTCEVSGHPFMWRHPFSGWQPGTVVQVKIREG